LQRWKSFVSITRNLTKKKKMRILDFANEFLLTSFVIYHSLLLNYSFIRVFFFLIHFVIFQIVTLTLKIWIMKERRNQFCFCEGKLQIQRWRNHVWYDIGLTKWLMKWRTLFIDFLHFISYFKTSSRTLDVRVSWKWWELFRMNVCAFIQH